MLWHDTQQSGWVNLAGSVVANENEAAEAKARPKANSAILITDVYLS